MYGLTAPWLVAATACSAAVRCVLYVLVLGSRVGCPTRGDAFGLQTRRLSDTDGVASVLAGQPFGAPDASRRHTLV